MSYVFWNIFWCLFIAALIGGAAGWLLKQFFGGGGTADLEANWRGRYDSLETERDKLAASLRESDGHLVSWRTKHGELDQNFQRLQADLAGLSGKLPEMETALAGWNDQARTWTGERTKLLADLDDWKRKAGDAQARLGKSESECASRLTDLEFKLNEALDAGRAGAAAHERQLAGLDASWSARLAAIESDRNSFREQLSDLSTRASASEGHANTRTAVLEGQLALAGEAGQAREAALAKQIAELQAELAAARLRNEKLIEDDQASDAAYEKQIAALKSESVSARLRIDSGEAAHEKDVAALKAEIASSRQRIEKLIDDGKASDAAYEKHVAHLKSELGKATAELTRTASDDRAGDAAYERRIAELTQHIETLDAEGHASRTAQEQQAAGLQTELAALRKAEGGGGKKALAGDIERIEGIGAAYGQKLRATGIAWVRDLLAQCGDAPGRDRIAAETGIKRDLILAWVNAADLLRVDGVTPDWAELLEASGVDTVKELRNRVPENLLAKMTETNPAGPKGRIAPTLPELTEVECWVEQAKAMRPRVTH